MGKARVVRSLPRAPVDRVTKALLVWSVGKARPKAAKDMFVQSLVFG